MMEPVWNKDKNSSNFYWTSISESDYGGINHFIRYISQGTPILFTPLVMLHNLCIDFSVFSTIYELLIFLVTSF